MNFWCFLVTPGQQSFRSPPVRTYPQQECTSIRHNCPYLAVLHIVHACTFLPCGHPVSIPLPIAYPPTSGFMVSFPLKCVLHSLVSFQVSVYAPKNHVLSSWSLFFPTVLPDAPNGDLSTTSSAAGKRKEN